MTVSFKEILTFVNLVEVTQLSLLPRGLKSLARGGRLNGFLGEIAALP